MDLVPREKLTPKPPSNPPKPTQQATQLSDSDVPASSETALSDCMRATSILPAPQDDGRIFLAVDGAIHALQRPNKTTTPLDGLDPGMHVNSLLAFRKVPAGLEILASIHVEGKSEFQINVLLVQSNAVVRVGLANLRFASPSDFFATYTAPRCSSDGTRCLRISSGDQSTYLEQWSAIGGTGFVPTTLAEFEGAQDAAWSPTNDGSAYVLKTCR